MHWDDAPEIRDAGEPPGGMWLAAQSVGKNICCNAWMYSPVLRQKLPQHFLVAPERGRMVDPHEYGLYGVDDAGTICRPESVFWRHGHMETYDKPVRWNPPAKIHYVD